MDIRRKVKKIVFVDSRPEIDNCFGRVENRMPELSSILFIAMNPKVQSYLSRRGLWVHNTLPYFGNGLRIEALEKSKILVEWLEKKVKFCNKELGIRAAFNNWFVFLVRFPINYCLWAIEIILNAVDIYQPEVILTFSSSSRKRPVSSVYIEPEEKYLAYLVRAIAKKRHIQYEDISNRINKIRSARFVTLLDYARCMFTFIFAYVKLQIWKKIILVKKLLNRKKVILFTTRLYQMNKLFKELQNQIKNKSFCFLNGPVMSSFNIPVVLINLFWGKYSKTIAKQKQIFEDLVRVIKSETEFFSHKNISFADVISQKVRDNLTGYIISQCIWSLELDQCIVSLDPSVILSNGNRPDDMLLAELCRQKNIPTVFVSHGSYVSPRNEYERFEWGEHGRVFLRAPFLFHALQSPLAEGYLDAFASPSKIIKTGPLIWGTAVNLNRSKLLFKKIFGDKYDFENIKVILHAGTPKSSNILRFHVYEAPDEYIQALCELAGAIDKISDTILVIKFRPTSEISIEDLKTLVPFSEKVVLSVKEPFIDMLGMSNLLVSFSSTTIEEALQNRIPVLLYGGGGRYQHISAYEIRSDNPIEKSAVYHVKEAKHLEYAIRETLKFSIDSNKGRHLFDPYIYPQDVRTSFIDLLKSIS